MVALEHQSAYVPDGRFGAPIRQPVYAALRPLAGSCRLFHDPRPGLSTGVTFLTTRGLLLLNSSPAIDSHAFSKVHPMGGHCNMQRGRARSAGTRTRREPGYPFPKPHGGSLPLTSEHGAGLVLQNNRGMCVCVVYLYVRVRDVLSSSGWVDGLRF